ncbi:hypothetical protein PIB30_058188 [Stylosanthes scabra]|uniref:Uncharacterized protein n=1 Tax=Stylosanthes scabra TaxID=79078 RepID=A0ABU6WJR3_9FABA|nr:hypothetical protein [Stylosanthes scabra]
MVINVFKAMQYPREDNVENYMRIDAIDMLIKEIQQEDALSKSNAKYEARLDDLAATNHESILQEKEDAKLQEKPTMELKPLPSTLKYDFLGKEERKMKKGSLRSKERNFEAFLPRVPRIGVEADA